MYSCKYGQCKNIYPLKIVRPLNKYHVEQRPQLRSVLEDLESNGHKVKDFVGDNPKRSNMREAKNFCSNYGCEYCVSKAVRYTEPISKESKSIENKLKLQRETILFQIDFLKSTPGTSETLKKNEEKINELQEVLKSLDEQKNKGRRSHTCWPSQTRNGELRTRAQIDNVMQLMEERNEGQIELTPDDLQGFVGRSLFLDIPGFNFVDGISCEYMHSTCIGNVKRLLELTFQVGENRSRTTTRRLTPPSVFNELMKYVKSPREFSRRIRQLDFSVFKAQEFRNIVLFFFKVVVDSLEPECKERKLWYMLAFMIRSCVIPNNEFNLVSKSEIKSTCDRFYVLYQQLFSEKNCTYSIHIVSSHLLQIRGDNPLTERSAFAFESFYGELRNSFVPGTVSPLKQMLQKVILRRSLAYHCCENSIFYSPNDTALECNSLIYKFVNNTHEIFKIVDVHDTDRDVFMCRKFGKLPFVAPELPNASWNKIGVYEVGGLSDEIVHVHRNSIAGKVIQVSSLFVTCPKNVLNEK